MRKLLMLILLAALALSACGKSVGAPTDVPAAAAATPLPSPVPTEPLALTVNGAAISLARYQAELQRLQAAESALGSPGDPDVEAQRVSDYLIDETLLAQAAAEAGYQPDEAELDARLAALQNEMGAQAFADWLTTYGYTPESFRKDLRQQMAALWMRNKIIDAVPPESEQAHVFQILLYNEEDANQVWQALASGTSFTDLAWQYDPQTGGDLGWVPSGYLLAPALNEALDALQPEQYSPVIATDAGYHILYVSAREIRPLSTNARLVLQEKALTDWLAARRADSDIRFAP